MRAEDAGLYPLDVSSVPVRKSGLTGGFGVPPECSEGILALEGVFAAPAVGVDSGSGAIPVWLCAKLGNLSKPL